MSLNAIWGEVQKVLLGQLGKFEYGQYIRLYYVIFINFLRSDSGTVFIIQENILFFFLFFNTSVIATLFEIVENGKQPV